MRYFRAAFGGGMFDGVGGFSGFDGFDGFDGFGMFDRGLLLLP